MQSMRRRGDPDYGDPAECALGSSTYTGNSVLCRTAQSAASVRERTPSFENRLRTWASTVRTLIRSAWAMSLLVWPSARCPKSRFRVRIRFQQGLCRGPGRAPGRSTPGWPSRPGERVPLGWPRPGRGPGRAPSRRERGHRRRRLQERHHGRKIEVLNEIQRVCVKGLDLQTCRPMQDGLRHVNENSRFCANRDKR